MRLELNSPTALEQKPVGQMPLFALMIVFVSALAFLEQIGNGLLWVAMRLAPSGRS